MLKIIIAIVGLFQSLNWTVRMASDLESQMVSVERVHGYSVMTQEAPHYLDGDPSPPVPDASNKGNVWPTKGDELSHLSCRLFIIATTAGEIVMENVCMRYREGLPLVLQGVTIKIEAREKVGIVGRYSDLFTYDIHKTDIPMD
jgi:ABC-type multidrug transport system fused ATPase/permease subunit